MRILPIPHSLNATVRVPGSKSLTNRALLLAALANGKTKITNALFADDTLYLVKALQTLGFDVQLDEERKEMTIAGLGGKIPKKKAHLFIGNAGTAARFLTAFLTLGHGEYILDGEPRMRERPIGDLADALTQIGAHIAPLSPRAKEECKEISLPLKITANGLSGGNVKITGNISSQFLSALLMVAPYAQNPIEIILSTKLVSKPYVEMTLAVMRDFGVKVIRNGEQYFSIPITPYHLPAPCFSTASILDPQRPTDDFSSIYPIEADASAASYFFAAPAICGGTVQLANLSRASVQGDIQFLDVLTQMGCLVEETHNGLRVTAHPPVRGIDVDLRDLPDVAPTLAAIAPFASSPTRIRGIASARFKETDRIHALCTELTRLGVHVEEYEDGMTIQPCQNFQPAVIQTYNDHRMAMAFSLIGLRFDGVTIENPSCVSKTFPHFFDVLQTLY